MLQIFFSLLLALLLESSLIAWPFVLLGVWWWSFKISLGRLVWIAVLVGVVLDVLLIRLVGTSAVLLWLFVLGLLVIRQWFLGGIIVERVYVLVMSVIWAYQLGGVRGWEILLILGLVGGLMVFKENVNFRWDIRLKN